MVHRVLLILAQVGATVLFIINFEQSGHQHWAGLLVPMVLIVMVLINSFWISRFLSWCIFSLGFFSFLVLISAFTLRWRLESGFDAAPFYRAMTMYAAFIYVSLGHLYRLKKGGQQ